MAGEALAAQDHEPSDRSGHHGDNGSGPHRVDHEVERKDLADVGPKVPAERRSIGRHDPGDVHHRSETPVCRSVWMAGASGWPTTTSRPSEVWRTSIGVL